MRGDGNNDEIEPIFEPSPFPVPSQVDRSAPPRYRATFPFCSPSEVVSAIMSQRLFKLIGKNGVMPVAPITKLVYLAGLGSNSMTINYGNRAETSWSYEMVFRYQDESTFLTTYFANHTPNAISLGYVDPRILDSEVSAVVQLIRGSFVR